MRRVLFLVVLSVIVSMAAMTLAFLVTHSDRLHGAADGPGEAPE